MEEPVGINKNMKIQDAVSEAPDLQKVNEQIYKHSLELATVNKALSLLKKLYQVSLLNLEPAAISQKISEAVRTDLNMETVGVFLFNEQTDSLIPFQFARSDRLSVTLDRIGFRFRDYTLKNVSQKPLLNNIVYQQKASFISKLEDIWNENLTATELVEITQESHVRVVLLYPLVSNRVTIGVLVFGLNRDYEILTEFEKDSIHNLVDVVAIALDKALLYEKLKETNEKLVQLDKARAEFISIASHQLRTPPATIKWYLSAIKSGDYGGLDAGVKEVIEKAEVTNNGQISLIDDLLNASRIERGKMEFLFEMDDLVNLCQIAFDQLVPQAKMRKLELIFNKPQEPLPPVVMDKEKLRQVINNFIDNSIKYTRQGSVTLSVMQDGTSLKVQVADTGKGIAPDAVPYLFEKYSRGKDSVMHATGLGLGLYVAKVVIEKHNGKIWAESDGEGKGSRFIFTLPIHNSIEPNSSATLDLAESQTEHK